MNNKIFVKVCGIKNIREAKWAIELGYNAIGIVVYKKSKRYVSFNDAKKIIEYAKNKILTVTVSLFYNDVNKYIDLCDYIQIYEYIERKTDNLIYSSHIEPHSKNFKYFLYDASRGSGIFEKFPEWLTNYKRELIIAGGLNSENVTSIIEKFTPFGIDVSSGVELKGIKNFFKMKTFIDKIRS